jgi:diadenosine tetraphosphate (Ap4A) HIT family hydrolase
MRSILCESRERESAEWKRVSFDDRLCFFCFVLARTKTSRVTKKTTFMATNIIVSRVLLLSSYPLKTSTRTLKRIPHSSLSSSSSSSLRTSHPSSLLTRGGRTNTTIIKRTMASKNDEQLNAQEAFLKGMQDSTEPTIFDKIVSKEIPATVLYEDNLAMAFKDVNPVAKTHFLVIPKIKAGLSQLSKANEDHKMLLGHCMYVAQMVAKQEKLDKGFRVVINDGVDGCQSVYHLHLHVIGGQQLTWPPGC